MTKLDKLQQVIYERLHRRSAGIDKLDRLWEAAVLLPLVETAEGIAVLFEERAHSLRRQPGQICFPGGKVECADADFAATAVRETCEELGLQPEDIILCGELDSLVTHMGPIIHPFVGLIKDTSKISYSPSEVEQVFTVPLKELLAMEPQRCSMQLADHPGEDFPFDLVPDRMKGWRKHKEYYVYFYKYKDHVIWGLTARMLYGFLYRGRKELEAFLQADAREDMVE
ncbi:NUDIX hydrolase [Phascolarctobacterium sp.]|uniref:NUDIX hydrolase n=1 Tax=Phascolarctobacterium sp. TaxID=2049039 RepID=UPI00386C9416